ncbi:hypothetical protein BSKO_03767 [Bryopsis sp. KO-2023]|nr:hypothetical protein BSKO_03767 [Bryopsis sp. KO-2023]
MYVAHAAAFDSRRTVQIAPQTDQAGGTVACVLIHSGSSGKEANGWTEMCGIALGVAKVFSLKIPWRSSGKDGEMVVVRSLQEYNSTHAVLWQRAVLVQGVLEGVHVKMSEGVVVPHSGLQVLERRWLDPDDAFLLLWSLISPAPWRTTRSDSLARRRLLGATKDGERCAHPERMISAYFVEESCVDAVGILVEADPHFKRRKRNKSKRRSRTTKTSDTKHFMLELIEQNYQVVAIGVAALSCLLAIFGVLRRLCAISPRQELAEVPPVHKKVSKSIRILHLVDRPAIPKSNQLWARDARGRLHRTVHCSTRRDSDASSSLSRYPQILHRTTAYRFSGHIEN